MNVTAQAAPLVDPRPTNRRPPLQRPTPSRCIRLHLDTHAQLCDMKPPDMSYGEAVLLLMRLVRYKYLGSVKEEELR